ncbi:MAG: RcpC/CpaB family pilus assembly protein [Planctomycetota bacterium]
MKNVNLIASLSVAMLGLVSVLITVAGCSPTATQTPVQVAPEPVAEAPPPPMATLLIVQSNLVADARIREQDVGQVAESLEKPNKRNVPLEKVFKSKQQAVGRILKKSKSAGSWLTEEDFYEVGKGPQLKLKEGHRAVTVRIDDPAISGSIIRTGCLVDVILTAENPDDSTKLTRRLVSGVEVLSPPVSDGGMPNSVTSASDTSSTVTQPRPPKHPITQKTRELFTNPTTTGDPLCMLSRFSGGWLVFRWAVLLLRNRKLTLADCSGSCSGLWAS